MNLKFLSEKVSEISLFALAALFFSGCGSLPVAGPSTSKILSEGKRANKTASGFFKLVSVNNSVLRILNSFPRVMVPNAKGANGGAFNVDEASVQKIAIGDVINVTIYTTGGGLFGGGQGMTSLPQSSGLVNTAGLSAMTGRDAGVSIGTSVPGQVVDQTEAITVPYVGRIKVVGKPPSQVESEISEKMKGMAFNPYAVVTMNDRLGSDLVTVTGDVKAPQRIRVPLPGIRVADAITQSGGSTARDFETEFTITRGGHTLYGNLATAIREPAYNTYLKPGDILAVRTHPWTYMTLGATGQTSRPFPFDNFSVAEAISSTTGLDDFRANPSGVFLYRLESPEVLSRLGLLKNCSGAEPQPVIYRFDLRAAGGFFLAKQFPMRDKDLVYVSDAGVVGLQKVLNIIGSVLSPGATGAASAARIAPLVVP